MLPEAHFAVVGDGELRQELEQLVERLRINHQVHFLGFRKDVENIYPDLDVLALTSSNEGSPVSLIEGLASGCAVIATDVGGVSDVVKEGLSGLLVPQPENAQDTTSRKLAVEILGLLKNPQQRQRLGEAGRRDVLQRFSIERLLADLGQLYRQSLAQKVL